MIDEFCNIIDKDLNKETVRNIRNAYAKDRTKFIQTCIETKLISETKALKALSYIYSIDFSEDIDIQGVRNDSLLKISKQFFQKKVFLPLLKEDKNCIIAINDPSDLNMIDDIANILRFEKYSLLLLPKKQILLAINLLYEQSAESAQQLVENIEENHITIVDDFEQTSDLLDDTSDAPVIRLVNHMISQAIKAQASDIHVEPFQEKLLIRYRIDGILYEILHPPKRIQASLISRIKVMARMNIAEKRVPQDGRTQVRIGDQEIDIRISTIPTSYGERLVMRLLNKSGYFLEFSEFGLSKESYKVINNIIRENNGIVLVTGPTGSGKTTTLYAALSEINSPDKNIITIEDPVEYNLEGIGQIQVNTKTGVTFAKGLRSIVRQDPDIVLVGEIRDYETAEIAIQSALTGHLVFSTLHTNDSAGAITRLVDLGVEPYLISSSVNAVIAQRLVRILCNSCKKKHRIDESHIKVLNGFGQEYIGKDIYEPQGCPECFNTGYLGREAIFEIMIADDDLKSLILGTSDSNIIKEMAIKAGMITLRQDGMKKVLEGLTSIREVLRVS